MWCWAPPSGARHADPATKAKYCYNGPAFRYQPQGADAAHPREFRQAGIERFGDSNAEVADAETIALIVKAIEAAGLREITLLPPMDHARSVFRDFANHVIARY